MEGSGIWSWGNGHCCHCGLGWDTGDKAAGEDPLVPRAGTSTGTGLSSLGKDFFSCLPCKAGRITREALSFGWSWREKCYRWQVWALSFPLNLY